MLRDVCFHFHIFKNAGTTVDWALSRCFGKRFAKYDEQHSSYVLSPAEVNRFLQRCPKLEAVSSHQARLTDRFHESFRIHRLVFIRHPIDRVGSVYSFNRRRTDVTPGSVKAKELSFPDYVRWQLKHRQSSPIGDFQTRCCSTKRGKQFHNHELTVKDLEVAIEYLSSRVIVGPVERLDECLTVAEMELSSHFPGIDLSYQEQNVSLDRALNLSARLDQMQLALGDDMMVELIQRNQLDMALHATVNEMLTTRIRAIPDFDRRLSAFRKRCSYHQAAA